MLVLTRKHHEKIRIGEHIVITVLKTKGKTVRLGIEAPAEVPVIRGELSFAEQSVTWPEKMDGVPQDAIGPASAEPFRTDRIRAHWPTESQLDGEPTRDTTRTAGATRVSLTRVARDQRGAGSSSDAAGTSPLRALLDRRSVSA